MKSYKAMALAVICLFGVSSTSTLSFAEEPQKGDVNDLEIHLLPEFRPIGGLGNNLKDPALNAAPGSAELELTPFNFAPHTNNGLIAGPNPRTISNVIAGGTSASGDDGQTDDPKASAWMYVFGQFLDHDLSLEATPQTAGSINITIPDGDPAFPKGASITLNRDLRDPTTNTIINTVAGYLDLSQLYGSTEAVAASIRGEDGLLKTSYEGRALPIVNNQFVAGDARVMENPELTATTILFMREHNRWARELKSQHNRWTSEEIYQMARAITTAEYQNVVYNEYVPTLIGPVLGPYQGYDAHVSAQVTQEFSTAVFRMGHSQVSDTQVGLDAAGNMLFTEALVQSFFNTPAQDMANGIDPLLRHMGADYSQATDVYTVTALRNLLTAGLVGGDTDIIDLIAIDIQRERDVGLGSLNQTRVAIGLSPFRSFAELTSDAVLQRNLEAVYGTIDNIDLFIGSLAEKHMPGAMVGQTLQLIIAEQFERLRAGDRFFWKNQAFGPRLSHQIEHTTLAEILERNTDLRNLQQNMFIEADVVPGKKITKNHTLQSTVNTGGRPLPAPFTQKHGDGQ